MRERERPRDVITSGRALALACGLLAVSGLAVASHLTYPASTMTLGDPAGVDVVFAAGDGSGPNTFITDFSADGPTFDATIRGYAGATIVVGGFFRINNTDTVAHDVRLEGDTITNAHVGAFTIEIMDGGSSRGVLDLKAATPALDVGTIPAGASFTGDLTVRLGDDARDNVSETVTLRLAVTP